jgi:hypothetical protein
MEMTKAVEASEAAAAKQQVAAVVNVAESRTRTETMIRDAAARFYLEVSDHGANSAAVIVQLIGPYIRAFRPSDKELSELLKDSNPAHMLSPRPTYLVEAGLETIERPTKAKPGSPYKQYASIWRDLSDIETGMWDRKKWEAVSTEAKVAVATGVPINGHTYTSPVSALEAGNPVMKVHRSFLDVLKPKCINLDTDIGSDHFAVAAEKAESLKVVVKTFSEEMQRHQPTAVLIAEHASTTAGVIVGLLKQAKVNQVVFTDEQYGQIVDALDKFTTN